MVLKSKWSPLIYSVTGPVVLLHGGLGASEKKRAAFLGSMNRISKVVQKLMAKRAFALDLVAEAVWELEADPLFNAGFGSKIQGDGVPRLSASLMDGEKQRMTSVAAVLNVKHPSAILRQTIHEKDRMLSGMEVSRLAFSRGIPPESVVTKTRLEEWKAGQRNSRGTVGAIAFDHLRKTAACTSTGGIGYEYPGRTSDSSTPAGNFATPYGAVSCTGTGEEIIDACVAASICLRLEDGASLQKAIERLLKHHAKKDFGFISLSARGEIAVQSTEANVTFAVITPKKIFCGLTRKDWGTYQLR